MQNAPRSLRPSAVIGVIVIFGVFFAIFCEEIMKIRVPSPPGAREAPQRPQFTPPEAPQVVPGGWQNFRFFELSRRSLAVVVLSN